MAPNISEEDLEYERDEHGNILTDEYGRPLSYRRGLHEARSSESEGEGRPAFTSFGSHDPADPRRPYPNTTTSSSSQQAYSSAAATPGQSMQTRPEADFGFFNEDEEEMEEEDGERRPSYSGQGYGTPPDEGAHYHPTRLSDVPEEDELSRASEVGASRGGTGIVNVTGALF